MTDEQAILEANLRFYRAFAQRDFGKMEGLWSKARPVACIHPGWPALVGLDAVLESWAQILSSPASPAVRCRAERVLAVDEVHMVVCEEVLGPDAVLVATNVFALDPEGWRMVLHQASPVAVQAGPREEPRPRHLH